MWETRQKGGLLDAGGREGLAEEVASELRCEGATVRRAEKRVSSREVRKSPKVGTGVAHLKKKKTAGKVISKESGTQGVWWGWQGPRRPRRSWVHVPSRSSTRQPGVLPPANTFLLAPVATLPWFSYFSGYSFLVFFVGSSSLIWFFSFYPFIRYSICSHLCS